MSQECVNSFVESLEDLLDSSDLEQFNLTVNEESFQLLHHYANHVIHGKLCQNSNCWLHILVCPGSHHCLKVWGKRGLLRENRPLQVLDIRRANHHHGGGGDHRQLPQHHHAS